MTPTLLVTPEVQSLIEAVCDGMADDAQVCKLESLLLSDVEARNFYVDFLDFDVKLQRLAGSLQEGEASLQEFISTQHAPLRHLAPSFLSTAYHGTIGFFSQELPFSLLIGTVLTGLGLWFASMVYVSGPNKIAKDLSSLPSKATFDPTLKVVGKITGMVHCKWADPNTETFNGANVLLGRKYVLASGLMEITYDTGAKVILQGPVTYEAESNGGYLAVGKLTGKLEKKVASGQWPEKVASGQWPVASKSEIPSPQSQVSSPFVVRTPTAAVTDLGTEFGVEVNALGDTETHVFAGKVELAGRDRRGRNVAKQMLVAGQTARLDANTATVTIQRSNAKRFVQQMPPSRQADHSGLIGQIDYSDTWTVNSLSRRGNNVLLVDANLLRVENCPGNPPRFWKFSTPTSVTARPSEGASQFWPGYQVHGCGSGFTEAIARECYFGLEYGLRDDFIVQFDAVQVRDRINLTVSDTVATFQCGNSLSVFIRASTTPLPEIALLASSKGPEIDTGLHSGIVTPHQWHNYAVRFNLREKTLTVWVDRRPCGTIRLATITRGMQTGSWADLPFTNRYVTVGGANGGPTDYIWTDNFCIGTPAQAATQIEQPQTTTSTPREN